jgi:hypothetical protein
MAVFGGCTEDLSYTNDGFTWLVFGVKKCCIAVDCMLLATNAIGMFISLW